MLSMNKYPQDYIDDCHQKVQQQVATYNSLAAAIAATNQGAIQSEIEAFEPHFFNNMVIVLDHYFCHRSRTLKLKDGKHLNEVRMLCNAMMENNNRMKADKTIKYKPDKSILKYNLDDEIKLSKDDFLQLAEAFFCRYRTQIFVNNQKAG